MIVACKAWLVLPFRVVVNFWSPNFCLLAAQHLKSPIKACQSFRYVVGSVKCASQTCQNSHVPIRNWSHSPQSFGDVQDNLHHVPRWRFSKLGRLFKLTQIIHERFEHQITIETTSCRFLSYKHGCMSSGPFLVLDEHVMTRVGGPLSVVQSEAPK